VGVSVPLIMSNWDTRWSSLATLVASWSKDASTKVGAIIINPSHNSVVSIGYNGLPRKVVDTPSINPDRHEGQTKYLYYEHAERNAIYNAAAQGHTLKGSTLYVTMHPCADCCRAIIQTQIKRVIVTNPEIKDSWRESCEAGLKMLKESGVEINGL